MTGGFTHARHLLRLLALYAAWVLSFLVVRAMLVPDRFGEHGHYRPAAVDEVAAVRPVLAGKAACLECHDEVSQDREQNHHAALSCEICHGALTEHAGDFSIAPAPAQQENGLCLSCHLAAGAKPAWFKQVSPAEHYPGDACAECHPPHQP